MAGTLGGGGGRRGIVSGINVTPLVDVCLVLLIILMVSSTYIVAQSLKIQLPKSHSSDGQAEKPSTVTLLKSGGMRWNDKDATEAEIIKGLTAAATADPDTNLVVSADKEVQHGRVVHLLDIAKIAGITKFAINVQAE
ncbi:MAG TPA: biopolymer transporter ExbD [Polyangia bacterium]|nr:biopolymer transporter ExbD [Polyangia bacterium]